MLLSPEQQVFVDHALRGHARLLAGPGTGKSFASVAFLENLASFDDPPRCHMITFTGSTRRSGDVGVYHWRGTPRSASCMELMAADFDLRGLGRGQRVEQFGVYEGLEVGGDAGGESAVSCEQA